VHASRLGSRSAFAGQMPLERRQTSQHRHHQLTVRRGGVVPRITKRPDLAPRSATVCRTLSRSRVDLANRSSRVTINTSPSASRETTLRIGAIRLHPAHLLAVDPGCTGSSQLGILSVNLLVSSSPMPREPPKR
jgi:hypothetical protein